MPARAFAADSGMAPMQAHDWTGVYFGGHIGGMVSRTTALEYRGFWDYGEYSKAEGAALAGAQAGFNRQLGNFVYGVEADIAASNFDVSQRFDNPYFNNGAWDWLATLRGRAGLAVGNGLVYATGGLALVHADYGLGDPSDDFTPDSGAYAGIALGAGYEHAIDANWSWRAEYLHVGLPNAMVTMNDEPGAFTSSAQMARLALNYAPGGNGYGAASGAVATPGDWSGWHAGANVAGMIGRSAALEYNGPWDNSEYTIEDWAAAAGLQIGYNWQAGHSVFGLEADIGATSFDGRHDFFYSGGQYNAANAGAWDWYSTLRARAGLAAGNAMAYVTGGVAVIRPDYLFEWQGNGRVADSPWQVGLAVGAGAELALGGNWSLRGEYLFIGLPEHLIADFDGDTGSFVSSAQMARLGVNYHFGGFAPGSGTQLPDTIGWAGPYAGIVGGAAITASTSTEYAGSQPAYAGEYTITDWMGTAGGLAGWNWQAGNFVYGVEADLAWTSWDQQHRFNAGDGVNSAEMDWLATIRGRAGIAAGNGLLYVTGGAAVARLDHSLRNLGVSTASQTVAGIAAGIGFEQDFGGGWSARLEAMHVAFPSIVDNDFDPDYPLNYTTSSNMARLALVKRM